MKRCIDVDPAFRTAQDAAFQAALEANVRNLAANPKLLGGGTVPPYLRQLTEESLAGKPVTLARADELSRIGTS